MAGQPTYPITGIPVVPTQPLPTRQEITSWYENVDNKYQVSLFMQALTVFMEAPIEERLSYFQVAGIHCYPLVGWDGEAGVKTPEESSDPFPGFCAHNRVTFPLWHRPYMLLFEQVLWEIMKSTIDSWKISDPSEEELWRKAANQWRLPYWDWAIPQPYIKDFGVPLVCTYEDVTVSMPYGKSKIISNPLKKFSNPKKDAGGFPVPMGSASMGVNAIQDHDPNQPNSTRKPPYNILPWSQCVGTSRYGITNEYHDLLPPKWVAGINNWGGSNLGLQKIGWYWGDTTKSNNSSLNNAVSRMLSPGYFNSFEYFASTKWNQPTINSNYLSIEYIHNVVHNMTGGQFISSTDIDPNTPGYLGLGLGHMSDVPVAAFDPIFWLHHCNIDRLLAIWQTFNNNWFDDPNPPQPDPNNPLPPDPTPSDPLLPFHYDAHKNPWDSTRARYWKNLGYQYDLLVPQAGVPEGSPLYLAELRSTINKLYPPPSNILRENVGGYLDSEGKYSDYIINVVYDRYALKGLAYSILFFIGAPPTDLRQFRTSANFVGLISTFSSPTENADGTPKCGNCAAQSKAKVLSKAQIPLTIPLVSKISGWQKSPTGGAPGVPQLPLPVVGDLKPHHVEALLRDEAEGLSWEFVALGGDLVDRSEFPHTQIAVLHGEGSHRAQNDPEAASGKAFRGYKVLREAVSNQPLGLGHPDSGPDKIVDDTE